MYLQGPLPGLNRTHADVSFEGAFHVMALGPGTYMLTVVDPFGTEIVSELVQVNSMSEPVSVSLPEIQRETPAAGTVSVTRLQHKPKPAAFNAFVRAEKFSDAHASKALTLPLSPLQLASIPERPASNG